VHNQRQSSFSISSTLIAEHPISLYGGANLFFCALKDQKRFLIFFVPDWETNTEHLENNRRLCITKSSFFESYIGVSQNKVAAKSHARQAIERFLKKLSEEGTLFRYLSDKGYKFTLWGSTNMDLYTNINIKVI